MALTINSHYRLSMGTINHPEEIIQLDEKLNVVILDFDEEKKRIALD